MPTESEYATSFPQLAAADRDVLRRGDPALVAAGLAALKQGAPELVVSVLAEIGADAPSADLSLAGRMFIDGVSETIGFKVEPDGKISPASPEDLTSGTKAITAVNVRLRLGNGSPDKPDPDRSDGLPVGYRRFVDWTRSAQELGLRLQLSPRISPTLNFSVPSIHAVPHELPALPHPRDGRGVVIGVIDWGCDFAHPAFCHHDGSTRLLALWDHNAPAVSGAPGGIGRIFDTAEINSALSTPNPYWALGYSPDANPFAPLTDDAVIHGTHVMGVAAGSRASNVPPGVAPAADLVFVHLQPQAVPNSQIQSGGGTLLLSVLWLFDKYKDRPVVANLSLGTNSGPHDGTSILELAFDWILGGQGRMIVLPAGNSFEDQLHSSGFVHRGRKSELGWHFKQGDPTPNAIDIWYETETDAAELAITLITPDKTQLEEPVGAPLLITFFDRLIGVVTTGFRPIQDTPRFLQQVHIELWPIRAAEEEWTIRLRLPSGPEQVRFHAWIDRDDLTSAAQSNFTRPVADRSCTLGSLSCGKKTLCVGAYYEIPPGQAAAVFSSAGPTRDGRLKPDIAAPGWSVLSAHAFGGPLQNPGSPKRYPPVVSMSGTSVSVPHVTGLVALLLQEKPNSDAGDIADLVRSQTQLLPPTFDPPGAEPRSWEPRFGFGRINAAASLWQQQP